MTTAFTINVDASILNDLRSRILATRFPDMPDEEQWQYGISLSYMKKLCAYWASEFNWRKTEATVNQYPQFITGIDGCNIHYLHIKSSRSNAVPVIISHGWPGSFLELLNIIPLLTENSEVAFDVVIPSLPGFGFSDKPTTAGADSGWMAGLWVKLMHHLGYEKFIAQGGDLGAFISTHIALQYPDNLIGLHLNYIPFNYTAYLVENEKLTEEETTAQQKTMQFFQAEGAYSMIQATKPLTLSYALNDSPAGLCAWILQIFKSFSDPQRPLEDLFDRDDLLAHVTLYWVTQTIHSSMGFYGERKEQPLAFGKDDFIKTPVGIAHYPYPDSFPARRYIERGYNVQYWNDVPSGGHFAAMEVPELFAGDLVRFATAIGVQPV
jgi:pimeloyl-ACP methyl ester carboxylesterase